MSGRQNRLARLLAADGIDLAAVDSLIPRPFSDARCAASLAQRRLWFLEQLQPGTAAYNVPVMLRLRGDLNRAALGRAMSAIAARHEVLRTRLVAEAGVPFQVVQPPGPVHIVTIDAGQDGGADDEAAYRTAAAALAARPFDLSQEAGWRVALLQRAADDHCLLFVFHHAMFDGASAVVLYAELERAYREALIGTPPLPDPLAVQYGDFAVWQIVRESMGALDRHVDYWVEALAGAPDRLALGGDRARGAVQSVAGGAVHRPLDAAVVERLAAVAREERATRFVAGLTAWTIWLRGRAGGPDLVVATPSAGRARGALQATIGMFVNTLPVRIDTSGTPTFRALVGRVRTAVTAGHEHEEAPLERVLNGLRLARELSHTPLTQVGFTFATHVARLPELPGVTCSRLPIELPAARTDLRLHIGPRPGGWLASLEYSADLFSADAAASALDECLATLERLSNAPDEPLPALAVAPPIRVAAAPPHTNLSPVQLRVWLDQQRTPDAPLYNVAIVMTLDGPLDAGAFDRAFARLVAGHDALRLSFSAEAGVPSQRVTDRAGRVERVDLSGAAAAEIDAWCQAHASLPFDLAGPLFRSILVACGPGRHRWLFVQHHLITDGWSVRLVCERLGQLYEAERRGETHEAAYPDFMTTAVPAGAGSCEADPPAPPVRFFGTLPVKSSTRVTRTCFALDSARAGRLREAASRVERATTIDHGSFLLLAAALVAQLHRMTGQSRIGLGFPHHNRRGGNRDVVGLFMDVLPLAVECGPSDTPGDLMAQVRAALRRALRRARATGAEPVRGQVSDVLLNVHTAAGSYLPGFAGATDWVHAGAERESLAIQLYGRNAGELMLGIDTHDDVFDAAAHRSFVQQFVGILDQVLDNPRLPVAALRLLAPAERQVAIAAGTGPHVTIPGGTVLDSIVRQAQAAPDHVAIESAERTVTYRDLVTNVQRTAAGLAARGVAPGDLVGICLPRAPEYVTAVLGALAAGAAYLPLDPDAPPARAARLARDADVRLLVSSEASAGATAIADLLAAPPAAQAVAREGADLAYVIYTSGSTGTPHGVEIPHRALANYTAYARDAFGVTPADRALQFAALTFDTAVEEIFPTLAAGATLVLREDAMLSSPATFMQRLEDARISILNLPTAYWHTLADAGVPLPACVRLVLVGGERMRAEQLERWRREVSPAVRILNGYGPTEATVVATFAEVSGMPGPHVSIGTPIWNVEAHVLDSCGEPVAPGQAGELFIGGAGLARVYRNDPALTAARFVANPFAAPGARLYRTGDLARRAVDGTLEFIGRIDGQVKIRGFRVEPAEIERALCAHRDVADAAVVAGEREGSTALAAWLVPARHARLEDAGVRAFLRERLPEYMVPADLWQLPSLPRTAHGKVDREALATSPGAALPRGGGHAAPRSNTERRLLRLWTGLLGRHDVGVHDSFFDIGGHSLRATQLAAGARAEFGVELPLRSIFEHPTVAAQAEIVDGLAAAAPAAPSGPGLVPAGPLSEAPPLSFWQERMWFLEQLTPGTSQYTMGALLRMRGPLRIDALQAALDGVVARHPALRTTFAAPDGHGVQIVHPPAPVVIERADVTGRAEPAAAAQALAQDLFVRPFDLTAGPLMRSLLISVAPGEHHFAVTFHHAIFDGWSSAIFVEELGRLYAAAVEHAPPDLPPAPADYAAFARWQHQELSGPALERLTAYWRAQLENAPELALPADASSSHDPRGDVEHFVLGTEDTAALAALGKATDTTPFMITAAALAVVLGRLADQQDVVFGTPIAGRVRAEFERTIGCFLNTLVLRCDLSGNPTVRTLLARVRETALGAFAHQDLPFERLVEALHPERSAGRQPFFEVMLNFVNTSPASATIADLEIAPLPIGRHDAKMALTVYASIRDGRLALQAVYRAAQFSRARVAAMLEQVAAVLRQMAADTEVPIEDLALLTSEAARVLPSPAAAIPAGDYPTVTELFVQAAAAHPDRIAVDDRGRAWTFAQLSRAAGDVGRRVRSAGLPPGARVGVAGTPGGAFLASLLALWSEGHVVVPLDPALPAERAAAMCRQADVKAFVVTERVPERWLSLATVIPVREDSLDLAGPGLEAGPAGDAGYVCFTSGSTGTPKGVLGAHRGLSHFVSWQRDTFEVTPADRVGQVTSPSFDVFFREALLPLTSGASIVVPAAVENTTSGATLSWLHRAAITVLHAVPAMAQSWLDAEPDVTALPALRVVFFAGEPLTRTLVERWRALAPGCRIVNLYGPTETTLAKCCHEVAATPAKEQVPIGRPMPGAQVLILRGDRRCGIGEPGELVIRTPYRSLGYLSGEHPGRFVRNPFTGLEDDIVYRTGDRGRYTPDGTIEIDGRLDDAVKIRGVRVDPAEVAAVLTSHRAVRHAAVLVDHSSGTSLIAYIACEAAPAPAALRRHLLNHLPAAAVPSRFVCLHALPRSSNGKVDRAALSALATVPLAPRTFEAPATPTERALAGLWAEVLDTNEVSRGDDFFEAGGHSLLAARLVARINQTFRVDLSIGLVFEEPTLAALAAAIERAASTPAPEAPPIARADRSQFKAGVA